MKTTTTFKTISLIALLTSVLAMPVIAEAGGGVYSREDFGPILNALDNMEKSEFESMNFNVYNERFQLFLALGIICLCIDFFILERKNKWLKNIDIYTISLGKKK